MTGTQMPARALMAVAVAASLLACGGLSDADAEKLVRSYNAHVIDAYRVGDVRLIDPVVGPNEGKKLTGFIGVKLDSGVTLDAELLELELLGVERANDEVLVRTEERWSYRDRKIGSGAQVGEASRDHYFMRYHLRRFEGRWVVDRIAFEKEPVVGRKASPPADVAAMHGTPRPETQRAEQPWAPAIVTEEGR